MNSSARRRPIVAIDGPAGAGKSTVARMLAKSLGLLFLDTGSLYRTVALAATREGISWDNGPALGGLIARLTAGAHLRYTLSKEGLPRLFLDGEEVSSLVRTPPLSRGASCVSVHPEVREGLLPLQRQLGQEGGLVLEGRDIGTVVFPDAEYLFFLTARPEVRAERRCAELRSKGHGVDMQETLQEILERDRKDIERSFSPLRQAERAVLVDNSMLTLEQTVQAMEKIVRT